MPPDTLWIMVDVETSGPVYGVHSMTELGAVAGSTTRGVFDRFEALIRPIGPGVVASPESYEKARVSGLEPGRRAGAGAGAAVRTVLVPGRRARGYRRDRRIAGGGDGAGHAGGRRSWVDPRRAPGGAKRRRP